MTGGARMAAWMVVDRSKAPPLSARSDDDLMLLVQRGNHVAFAAIVRRHQARVLRIAARYVRDLNQAQDVSQGVFLELYRNRARYEPRSKFLAYLCRIALNQCRMSIRASRTARYHVDIDTSVSSLAIDPISSCERRRDLDLALSELSEKLRSVVILRYVADLDHAQIADALEIPMGTVKRRLFDAMSRLRATLSDPSHAPFDSDSARHER
ncbi:MAG TPA: sigma-70 family RNA polymerase sigma factor [Polyangiales bacterium]|nr:sigma-70 family RNA polymerase sigma factor [Polyangiales bacterium]